MNLLLLSKKAESYSSPSMTKGASILPSSLPEEKIEGDTPDQIAWLLPDMREGEGGQSSGGGLAVCRQQPQRAGPRSGPPRSIEAGKRNRSREYGEGIPPADSLWRRHCQPPPDPVANLTILTRRSLQKDQSPRNPRPRTWEDKPPHPTRNLMTHLFQKHGRIAHGRSAHPDKKHPHSRIFKKRANKRKTKRVLPRLQ